MVFKGDTNESAVLCTETKTYDVKEAETSNSILLIPELTFPDEESSDIELCSRNVIYCIRKTGNILLIYIYNYRSLVFSIHTMK